MEIKRSVAILMAVLALHWVYMTFFVSGNFLFLHCFMRHWLMVSIMKARQPDIYL